jgi:hypothetical protein
MSLEERSGKYFCPSLVSLLTAREREVVDRRDEAMVVVMVVDCVGLLLLKKREGSRWES